MAIGTALPTVTSLLLVGALGACGTPTTIPIEWRDPAFQGPSFQKIFVVGVAENDTSRRRFEDQFVGALAGRGVAASSSYGVLPSTERLSEEQIRRAMGSGGHDGVIVTRLLGVEDETTYVPPQTYTAPRSYRGYGGYYGSSWEVVHEPGYYQTHTYVRLETNLYSVSSGELVWSGQSETLNSGSVEGMIESVTRAVAKRLGEEGLIP
jgi:hypothetical protein